MKTMTALIILALALCFSGCHKNSDDSTGPGDTTGTFDPLKPDQTDVELNTYPGTIAFEDVSNSGPWAVAIFPPTGPGRILTVTINGELTKAAKPHNGRYVAQLRNTGDKYLRPLNFVIVTTTGRFIYSTAPRVIVPGTTPTGRSVSGAYSGNANPDGARSRPHFRFPAKVAAYGNFTFSFDGGKIHSVKASDMTDGRHEPGGGILVKSPDNRGGTVILGEFGTRYKTCTLKY